MDSILKSNLFRRATNACGTSCGVDCISGGDGLCAMVVNDAAANTIETYVVYSDHLGSIEVLTDLNGNIVAEQSFDAWGRYRVPNNWDYYSKNTVNNLPDWLWRGFTGHEHMEEFQLINMNGRLYDPYLGRMLSPDNYVQDATSTQAYNRYTYALNNPLKYTDPDGESIIGAIIIGAMINATIQGLSGNLNSHGDFYMALGVGGLSGAAGAWAGGAVAGAIGYGGFAGGATIGAASGFAGGFVGGTGNAWKGGSSFGDGLVLGLQSGTIGAVTGGLIGGAVGGIQAHKSGLDFWKGDRIINESVFNETYGLSSACEGCGFQNGDLLSDFKADLSGSDDYRQLMKSYAKAKHYVQSGKNVEIGDIINLESATSANGWDNFDSYFNSKSYMVPNHGKLKMLVPTPGHEKNLVIDVAIADNHVNTIALYQRTPTVIRPLSYVRYPSRQLMLKGWMSIR